MRLKTNILLLVSTILLASCKKQEAKLSSDEEARRDSAALHVAVMPVQDCLPVFLAQEEGLFEKAGLDVRLTEYNSLMDCDTALTKHHVELSYSDLARTILWNHTDTIPVVWLRQMPGSMMLVTAKDKRVRTIAQLKERMVALDRHSTADYWSDEILLQTNMDRDIIYRPQFNDVILRTQMLLTGLVDAALLPYPYGPWAETEGNRCLWESPERSIQWAVFNTLPAIQQDTIRTRQMNTFFDTYNQAVDRLNDQPSLARSIMARHCQVPEAALDSMPQPSFRHLDEPNSQQEEKARQWLQKRRRL